LKCTMTMERIAIVMASLAMIAFLVDANAWVDRTENVMGVLKLVDISDREMNDWWGKFDILWAGHKQQIAEDPDILCKVPDWSNVLKKLQETKRMILLVESGLIAMKTQLKAIREILEGQHLGPSLIHCETDPTSAVCIALKKLDEQAHEKQKRLDAEKSAVDREITRVENHNCDCKWPDFTGAWGKCSEECGPGTQVETRKPLWLHRNRGTPCQAGDYKRVQKCSNGCCPVHCQWANWEAWGSCEKVCKLEPNFRHRIRKIKVEGTCINRGGTACKDEDANGEEQCDIISVMNQQIADKKAKIAELKALIELYKAKLCEPTPCMNGGKCFMGVCSCTEGWSGTHCRKVRSG